jgi:hypothetical protein
MPYSIKLSNGETLVDIPDGKVDFATTSLNLVGKNVAGYGFYQNTNFVQLLENFSNNFAPDSPIKGQLWFDSNSNSLKVYNGTTFKVVGEDYVKARVFQTTAQRDTALPSPQVGTIVVVENVGGSKKFMGYLGAPDGWVALN